MTTLAYAVTDSTTMLRRNLRHALRYPGMTVASIGMPIVFLLLFVYGFGGALGTGIGDGGDYVDYVAPGIILMGATAGSVMTAVSVCVDMTEGIVNRFRTMAIARSSVLTGHVVGSAIQTLISIVLVVGVAVLVGFRPNASALEWLATFGLLALLTVALTWLAAAFGLVSKTPESASNVVLPLQFLPFLGSAIVPPDTMPAGVRWFAEHQPYTPIIDTLRGLLMGTEIGDSAALAVAWCLLILAVGYLWARKAYRREPTR